MDDGGPVNGTAELKEILQGDVTWHGKNQDKSAAYGLRERWNHRSMQDERERGKEREKRTGRVESEETWGVVEEEEEEVESGGERVR